MANIYVFGDESGCYGFHRKGNASRYFIVCNTTSASCGAGHALADLRREMICDGLNVEAGFHAASDKQMVRDAVYQEICQHDFTVQATILEKSKAQPQTRTSKARFYQYAWYYHLQYVAPKIIPRTGHVLVTAAQVGSKPKTQAAFTSAVNDVVQQTIPRDRWTTEFRPSGQDPCLQVADYCAWAIQRRWEQGDDRPWQLIKDHVTHEKDSWAHGTKHYY